MAEFPALPLWTDAYLGDTTHLTTIEHGAYLLLLMAMWRRDGTLPNDDKLLARYARLTAGQWKKMKPTLMEFFTVSGDEISQGRLTDELDAVRQHSKKQSDNAKARWLKKKETTDAAAMPDECQTDAPLPLPLPSKEDSVPNGTDADGVCKPGSEDHNRLLFRLARKCRRPSAPTELRKLGMEDIRVETILRDALQRAEPRAYLAGILTKQARDGPKHWNDFGTQTGMSPTLERMIFDEQREQDCHSDPGTPLLAAAAGDGEGR